MPVDTDELCRALWAELERNPAAVGGERFTVNVLRALVATVERGFGDSHPDDMTDEQLRGVVLRTALQNSPLPLCRALWECVDNADARMSILDNDPLYAEQILCLLDPEREEEALCMLDDMQARSGMDADHAAAFVDWLNSRAGR